ncbi:MAG: ABC transporter permease [Clostridiales Family XIII bacterium]|nr:ABC transporter permease [Clostridiales Family XIII bacterium]
MILPLLILFAWLYVTGEALVPALLLPKPRIVLNEFIVQLTVGTIIEDISISFGRIVKGFGLAVLFGGGLGIIMGMFVPAERFFSLTFTSIRQIPMMAWVPLLVMWFGIGEASKVAVILMAAYFPILMNTSSGIRRTDPKLIEVGRMYRLTPWRMFVKIYLPSALPSIFVGLKLGLSISWMAVVGAEMIAASSGIGFRLNDARALMQFPIVFCGMFAIAIAGVLMDWVLTLISRAAAPWERKR